MDVRDLTDWVLHGDHDWTAIIWLMSNVAGVAASCIAVILVLGDRRRAYRRWRERGRKSDGYQDRFAIAILGDSEAQSEVYKAIIHIGHGCVGVAVMLAPSPVRPQLSLVILIVTFWLIVSSWLVLLSTIMRLKARYDYRSVRRSGRRETWRKSYQLLVQEVRDEMRDIWHGRKRNL